MKIRPYEPADRDQIVAMRERHGDYWFADPDDPMNPLTLVAEEDGKVVAAMTARKTVEGFLTIDPNWGSGIKRWGVIRQLIEGGSDLLSRWGISEAHISVPQGLSGYAKLLSKLPHVYEDDRRHLLLAVWEAGGR